MLKRKFMCFLWLLKILVHLATINKKTQIALYSKTSLSAAGLPSEFGLVAHAHTQSTNPQNQVVQS